MASGETAAPEPAGASGGGGAPRRDEAERTRSRAADDARARAPGGWSPPEGAQLRSAHAPPLVSAHAPSLMPVHAPPRLPMAIAAPIRPPAAEPALEEASAADEREDARTLGAVGAPRPLPPGGAGLRLQRTSLPELISGS